MTELMCLVAQYVCTQCSTGLTGSLLGGVITCYVMHMHTHTYTVHPVYPGGADREHPHVPTTLGSLHGSTC